MGLFARLFKTRPKNARAEGGEGGSSGGVSPPVALGGVPPPGLSAPRQEVVLHLGDVLSFIPPQLLRAGTPDPRRELRFSLAQFADDIARGRASVPLSAIAAQCPEIFQSAIPPEDDLTVRLPLQKLLEQIIQPEAPILDRPCASEPTTVPTPIEASIPVEPDGATISLSLAAIVAGCPEDIFTGPRPCVDDSVRVTLPFAPVERQLAGGRVEIGAARFVALLSPAYAGSFRAGDGARIPLPLEEIFRNLPGNAKSEPPAIGESEAAPIAEAPSARPQFMFFSPAPPVPRHLAPPNLVAAIAAAEPPVPRAAESTPIITPPAEIGAAAATSVPRPLGAPPVRSIEIRPSAEEPVISQPTARVLESTAPPPTLVTPPEQSAPAVPRVELVRPLVVLPPPIGGMPPATAAPEAAVETTADQTAVLEFLSGIAGPASARD